ncbi:MAG: shikimate dehydrogenase [Bacteroidetes bacterium]|nr:shikimate dehydrogenase [Bacteroidota bacterium]
MRCFGLIGFPLTHSFSEKYFTDLFREKGLSDLASYKTYPLEDISELPQWLENHPEVCGLNVTIPYKISVLRYLHHIDPVAHAVGAVNTICITKAKGKMILTGYNTDVVGFEKTLDKLPGFCNALILGTGGAARAVAFVLQKRNIPFTLVSRKPGGSGVITYGQITSEVMDQHPCIIQTTPLGTFPDTTGKPPIPYEHISPHHILYDLTYNPEKTVFLQEGEKRGAVILNGYPMLVSQADESWRIWRHSFF